MAFSWGDFLALAHGLAQSGDQASLRTAVSRAYYFAFHAAEPVAKASSKYAGFKAAGRGSHEAVWLTLQAEAKPEAQEAGSEGCHLRAQRTHADYYRTPAIGKADVLLALKTAQVIETRLRSC